ncbi:hypothetical protein CXZ13_16115 (plasmid) [Lactiplantibacillus plantarum]|uniref:hypothetical protein n=1 Tax=Lactiplantibacillus plantarum TaxID=1590 RepID=UPI000CA1D617|nr:hypothetical protein [Lactiplantibacillus plantarum]AUH38743.1 hypothetical protein CXZ13_16115 [Lactiplantibacillus plantarum]MCB7151263.1 hypothetical protein [Lactiplantibacillus plantarum]MCB7170729.1 hypothetical protein [Lactiplantibacillus plantarum]MCG0659995.1 hypothetical protein [Lactiplantibacillus plantarum]
MARQNKWISLSQAGIKLGHDRSYVSLWLRRHPNSMPEEYLMETGTVKLISLEGIEWIKKQSKKEGVLVSSRVANGDQHLELRLLGVTLLIIHFTGWAMGKLVA